MLLPLAPAEAHKISIENHLTLEVLRSGRAGVYHLGSLAQASYITRFLCEAGYGVAREGLFLELDEAHTRCHQQAEEAGVYRAEDEACVLLGEMLTLHDQQLAGAPVGELMKANDRLTKFRATE
jgi:hypothetical protein